MIVALSSSKRVPPRWAHCLAVSITASLTVLLWYGNAQAGIAETYGASSMIVGRAGAGAADAPSPDAALLNPALLSLAERIDFAFGINVAKDALRINDKDADPGTYIGYNIGVAARVPLGSFDDRLFVGLKLHLPQEGLYDLQTALPDQPRILFHDAHVRHFDLAFGLSLRLWRSLAIGAGFTLLPDVDGTVSIDFRNGSDAHATDVSVGYNFAPALGLYASPLPGLHLGFSWRGAHRTSLNIPVDVVVSDQIGAIHTAVTGVAFGEPDRFLFGLSYDFSALAANPLTRFTARAEFGYEHYREDVASVSSVTLYDDDGKVLDVSETRAFQFEDSWHIAASLDWRPLDILTLTAGYAWQTTPVPAQRDVLNILDASRHTLSFGLTGWLPRAWLSVPRQIGLSTSAMFSFYQRREMEKYALLHGNYGYPGITFDGISFSWHCALLLSF